eukprot:8771190-Pyramimonas_sp.AAC.1
MLQRAAAPPSRSRGKCRGRGTPQGGRGRGGRGFALDHPRPEGWWDLPIPGGHAYYRHSRVVFCIDGKGDCD